MAKSWRYFLFLLWLAYLILAAILLFTRGFLLTRVTHAVNATCIPYIMNPCKTEESGVISQTHGIAQCFGDEQVTPMNHLHSASRICLPQKARVILIVIDALRYDFTVYDPSLERSLPFQNKLPVIDDLLKTYPSSTRLYRFIADPPTTTMQRLKALTTGSLPTFIDAGSNFATPEINEDNIIDQLVKQMHNVVFMGDDTWVSLYPNRFIRNYPFPSFNVFDLDTVDTGVIQNLYPELERKDWNLLIGHFLGVDHCGHRYGPMHSEMSRKLTEMNQVIEYVAQRLTEDTVLIVIGDHGMTSTGDHGGESDDEVTSAMFIHSKSPLIPPLGNTIRNSTIKQVDLVPTLATILGIPIPYSNLGSLIVDSLPLNNKTQTSFPHWEAVLFSVWSNVQQMTSYIKEYAITSQTFSQERLQNLYEKFALLNARVRTIRSENEFNVFVKDAKDYTTMLRQMCEDVWIQFDSFSMSRGLVLMFISMFLVYLIVSGIPSNQLPQLFMSSFLSCSYLALAVTICFCGIFFYFGLVENLLSTIFFGTGITSVVMLSVLVVQNWDIIAIHWYDLSRNKTNMDLIFRFIFLLSWCGLLSNSYIVEEGYVSLFLLSTILFIMIYQNNKQRKPSVSIFKASNQISKVNWVKVKLLLIVGFACILIRLSVNYWKCREEQQWWCASHLTLGMKSNSRTERADYLITLVTVAVFVTATRNWLRSCGNLVGFSPSVFLFRYGPTVMVVATGGFWVLHSLPKDTKSRLMIGWQTDYLAQVVYIFIILGIISIIVKPLCVYIIPDKKEVDVSSSKDNVIPQLFNQIKGLFDEKFTENNDSTIPIVCGLATVYSAAFVAVSVYISLLMILLLGDIIATSAVMLYFVAASILIVTAICKLEKATKTAHLFEVSNSSILAWMLLSLYFFYASGHQAAFSNIAWEAAFVGTGGVFTNNFIPGSLVIINTFGSYILMGITLPLLFIAPFTVHVMFPSIYTKKSNGQDLQKDLSRGEILLYENDAAMMNGIFAVCCKYILYHGVRVLVSMLAATIHCRHLMVWKIFAPKLIFEAIGMLVTLGSVLIGYLLVIRVNSKVNGLVLRLNKQHR